MVVTFQLSVTSEDETAKGDAAGYLEDLILDAEMVMPRHTKTWIDDNTVEIGFSEGRLYEDLSLITEGMMWAAKVACIDTFYKVVLEELHDGIVRVNHTLRVEIPRQRL